MGFLTDWYVIGPFDGMGQQGFRRSYQPESKIDLAAELPGQNGKVRWKSLPGARAQSNSARRPPSAGQPARQNGAGGCRRCGRVRIYGIQVPAWLHAEFRGAADDNFTVWVNGVRAFGFEEWRNGIRLDRHRFKVNLKAGKNTVLVKVCQTPVPNPEPNWEFFLRVVDTTGKGIAMKLALPE